MAISAAVAIITGSDQMLTVETRTNPGLSSAAGETTASVIEMGLQARAEAQAEDSTSNVQIKTIWFTAFKSIWVSLLTSILRS